MFLYYITLMVKVFIASLVTFGISEMVTVERGPFNIFDRLRDWFGKSPEHGAYPSRYDQEKVVQWRQRHTELLSLHQMWLDHDLEFAKTLRGTIFGILDCSYCMCTWILFLVTFMFIMALPVTTAWPIIVVEAVSIFGGGLAGHRIIKSWLEG